MDFILTNFSLFVAFLIALNPLTRILLDRIVGPVWNALGHIALGLYTLLDIAYEYLKPRLFNSLRNLNIFSLLKRRRMKKRSLIRIAKRRADHCASKWTNTIRACKARGVRVSARINATGRIRTLVSTLAFLYFALITATHFVPAALYSFKPDLYRDPIERSFYDAILDFAISAKNLIANFNIPETLDANSTFFEIFKVKISLFLQYTCHPAIVLYTSFRDYITSTFFYQLYIYGIIGKLTVSSYILFRLFSGFIFAFFITRILYQGTQQPFLFPRLFRKILQSMPVIGRLYTLSKLTTADEMHINTTEPWRSYYTKQLVETVEDRKQVLKSKTHFGFCIWCNTFGHVFSSSDKSFSCPLYYDYKAKHDGFCLHRPRRTYAYLTTCYNFCETFGLTLPRFLYPKQKPAQSRLQVIDQRNPRLIVTTTTMPKDTPNQIKIEHIDPTKDLNPQHLTELSDKTILIFDQKNSFFANQLLILFNSYFKKKEFSVSLMHTLNHSADFMYRGIVNERLKKRFALLYRTEKQHNWSDYGISRRIAAKRSVNSDSGLYKKVRLVPRREKLIKKTFDRLAKKHIGETSCDSDADYVASKAAFILRAARKLRATKPTQQKPPKRVLTESTAAFAKRVLGFNPFQTTTKQNLKPTKLIYTSDTYNPAHRRKPIDNSAEIIAKARHGYVNEYANCALSATMHALAYFGLSPDFKVNNPHNPWTILSRAYTYSKYAVTKISNFWPGFNKSNFHTLCDSSAQNLIAHLAQTSDFSYGFVQEWSCCGESQIRDHPYIFTATPTDKLISGFISDALRHPMRCNCGKVMTLRRLQFKNPKHEATYLININSEQIEPTAHFTNYGYMAPVMTILHRGSADTFTHWITRKIIDGHIIEYDDAKRPVCVPNFGKPAVTIWQYTHNGCQFFPTDEKPSLGLWTNIDELVLKNDLDPIATHEKFAKPGLNKELEIPGSEFLQSLLKEFEKGTVHKPLDLRFPANVEKKIIYYDDFSPSSDSSSGSESYVYESDTGKKTESTKTQEPEFYDAETKVISHAEKKIENIDAREPEFYDAETGQDAEKEIEEIVSQPKSQSNDAILEKEVEKTVIQTKIVADQEVLVAEKEVEKIEAQPEVQSNFDKNAQLKKLIVEAFTNSQCKVEQPKIESEKTLTEFATTSQLTEKTIETKKIAPPKPPRNGRKTKKSLLLTYNPGEGFWDLIMNDNPVKKDPTPVIEPLNTTALPTNVSIENPELNPSFTPDLNENSYPASESDSDSTASFCTFTDEEGFSSPLVKTLITKSTESLESGSFKSATSTNATTTIQHEIITSESEINQQKDDEISVKTSSSDKSETISEIERNCGGSPETVLNGLRDGKVAFNVFRDLLDCDVAEFSLLCEHVKDTDESPSTTGWINKMQCIYYYIDYTYASKDLETHQLYMKTIDNLINESRHFMTKYTYGTQSYQNCLSLISSLTCLLKKVLMCNGTLPTNIPPPNYDTRLISNGFPIETTIDNPFSENISLRPCKPAFSSKSQGAFKKNSTSLPDTAPSQKEKENKKMKEQFKGVSMENLQNTEAKIVKPEIENSPKKQFPTLFDKPTEPSPRIVTDDGTWLVQFKKFFNKSLDYLQGQQTDNTVDCSFIPKSTANKDIFKGTITHECAELISDFLSKLPAPVNEDFNGKIQYLFTNQKYYEFGVKGATVKYKPDGKFCHQLDRIFKLMAYDELEPRKTINAVLIVVYPNETYNRLNFHRDDEAIHASDIVLSVSVAGNAKLYWTTNDKVRVFKDEPCIKLQPMETYLMTNQHNYRHGVTCPRRIVLTGREFIGDSKAYDYKPEGEPFLKDFDFMRGKPLDSLKCSFKRKSKNSTLHFNPHLIRSCNIGNNSNLDKPINFESETTHALMEHIKQRTETTFGTAYLDKVKEKIKIRKELMPGYIPANMVFYTESASSLFSPPFTPLIINDYIYYITKKGDITFAQFCVCTLSWLRKRLDGFRGDYDTMIDTLGEFPCEDALVFFYLNSWTDIYNFLFSKNLAPKFNYLDAIYDFDQDKTASGTNVAADEEKESNSQDAQDEPTLPDGQVTVFENEDNQLDPTLNDLDTQSNDAIDVNMSDQRLSTYCSDEVIDKITIPAWLNTDDVNSAYTGDSIRIFLTGLFASYLEFTANLPKMPPDLQLDFNNQGPTIVQHFIKTLYNSYPRSLFSYLRYCHNYVTEVFNFTTDQTTYYPNKTFVGCERTEDNHIEVRYEDFTNEPKAPNAFYKIKDIKDKFYDSYIVREVREKFKNALDDPHFNPRPYFHNTSPAVCAVMHSLDEVRIVNPDITLRHIAMYRNLCMSLHLEKFPITKAFDLFFDGNYNFKKKSNHNKLKFYIRYKPVVPALTFFDACADIAYSAKVNKNKSKDIFIECCTNEHHYDYSGTTIDKHGFERYSSLPNMYNPLHNLNDEKQVMTDVPTVFCDAWNHYYNGDIPKVVVEHFLDKFQDISTNDYEIVPRHEIDKKFTSEEHGILAKASRRFYHYIVTNEIPLPFAFNTSPAILGTIIGKYPDTAKCMYEAYGLEAQYSYEETRYYSTANISSIFKFATFSTLLSSVSCAGADAGVAWSFGSLDIIFAFLDIFPPIVQSTTTYSRTINFFALLFFSTPFNITVGIVFYFIILFAYLEFVFGNSKRELLVLFIVLNSSIYISTEMEHTQSINELNNPINSMDGISFYNIDKVYSKFYGANLKYLSGYTTKPFSENLDNHTVVIPLHPSYYQRALPITQPTVSVELKQHIDNLAHYYGDIVRDFVPELLRTEGIVHLENAYNTSHEAISQFLNDALSYSNRSMKTLDSFLQIVNNEQYILLQTDLVVFYDRYNLDVLNKLGNAIVHIDNLRKCCNATMRLIMVYDYSLEKYIKLVFNTIRDASDLFTNLEPETIAKVSVINTYGLANIYINQTYMELPDLSTVSRLNKETIGLTRFCCVYLRNEEACKFIKDTLYPYQSDYNTKNMLRVVHKSFDSGYKSLNFHEISHANNYLRKLGYTVEYIKFMNYKYTSPDYRLPSFNVQYNEPKLTAIHPSMLNRFLHFIERFGFFKPNVIWGEGLTTNPDIELYDPLNPHTIHYYNPKYTSGSKCSRQKECNVLVTDLKKTKMLKTQRDICKTNICIDDYLYQTSKNKTIHQDIPPFMNELRKNFKFSENLVFTNIYNDKFWVTGDERLVNIINQYNIPWQYKTGPYSAILATNFELNRFCSFTADSNLLEDYCVNGGVVKLETIYTKFSVNQTYEDVLINDKNILKTGIGYNLYYKEKIEHQLYNYNYDHYLTYFGFTVCIDEGVNYLCSKHFERANIQTTFGIDYYIDSYDEDFSIDGLCPLNYMIVKISRCFEPTAISTYLIILAAVTLFGLFIVTRFGKSWSLATDRVYYLIGYYLAIAVSMEFVSREMEIDSYMFTAIQYTTLIIAFITNYGHIAYFFCKRHDFKGIMSVEPFFLGTACICNLLACFYFFGIPSCSIALGSLIVFKIYNYVSKPLWYQNLNLTKELAGTILNRYEPKLNPDNNQISHRLSIIRSKLKCLMVGSDNNLLYETCDEYAKLSLLDRCIGLVRTGSKLGNVTYYTPPTFNTDDIFTIESGMKFAKNTNASLPFGVQKSIFACTFRNQVLFGYYNYKEKRLYILRHLFSKISIDDALHNFKTYLNELIINDIEGNKYMASDGKVMHGTPFVTVEIPFHYNGTDLEHTPYNNGTAMMPYFNEGNFKILQGVFNHQFHTINTTNGFCGLPVITTFDNKYYLAGIHTLGAKFTAPSDAILTGEIVVNGMIRPDGKFGVFNENYDYKKQNDIDTTHTIVFDVFSSLCSAWINNKKKPTDINDTTELSLKHARFFGLDWDDLTSIQKRFESLTGDYNFFNIYFNNAVNGDRTILRHQPDLKFNNAYTCGLITHDFCDKIKENQAFIVKEINKFLEAGETVKTESKFSYFIIFTLNSIACFLNYTLYQSIWLDLGDIGVSMIARFLFLILSFLKPRTNSIIVQLYQIAIPLIFLYRIEAMDFVVQWFEADPDWIQHIKFTNISIDILYCLLSGPDFRFINTLQYATSNLYRYYYILPPSCIAAMHILPENYAQSICEMTFEINTYFNALSITLTTPFAYLHAFGLNVMKFGITPMFNLFKWSTSAFLGVRIESLTISNAEKPNVFKRYLLRFLKFFHGNNNNTIVESSSRYVNNFIGQLIITLQLLCFFVPKGKTFNSFIDELRKVKTTATETELVLILKRLNDYIEKTHPKLMEIIFHANLLPADDAYDIISTNLGIESQMTDDQSAELLKEIKAFSTDNNTTIFDPLIITHFIARRGMSEMDRRERSNFLKFVTSVLEQNAIHFENYAAFLRAFKEGVNDEVIGQHLSSDIRQLNKAKIICLRFRLFLLQKAISDKNFDYSHYLPTIDFLARNISNLKETNYISTKDIVTELESVVATVMEDIEEFFKTDIKNEPYAGNVVLSKNWTKGNEPVTDVNQFLSSIESYYENSQYVSIQTKIAETLERIELLRSEGKSKNSVDIKSLRLYETDLRAELKALKKTLAQKMLAAEEHNRLVARRLKANTMQQTLAAQKKAAEIARQRQFLWVMERYAAVKSIIQVIVTFYGCKTLAEITRSFKDKKVVSSTLYENLYDYKPYTFDEEIVIADKPDTTGLELMPIFQIRGQNEPVVVSIQVSKDHPSDSRIRAGYIVREYNNYSTPTDIWLEYQSGNIINRIVLVSPTINMNFFNVEDMELTNDKELIKKPSPINLIVTEGNCNILRTIPTRCGLELPCPKNGNHNHNPLACYQPLANAYYEHISECQDCAASGVLKEHTRCKMPVERNQHTFGQIHHQILNCERCRLCQQCGGYPRDLAKFNQNTTESCTGIGWHGFICKNSVCDGSCGLDHTNTLKVENFTMDYYPKVDQLNFKTDESNDYIVATHEDKPIIYVSGSKLDRGTVGKDTIEILNKTYTRGTYVYVNIKYLNSGEFPASFEKAYHTFISRFMNKSDVNAAQFDSDNAKHIAIASDIEAEIVIKTALNKDQIIHTPLKPTCTKLETDNLTTDSDKYHLTLPPNAQRYSGYTWFSTCTNFLDSHKRNCVLHDGRTHGVRDFVDDSTARAYLTTLNYKTNKHLPCTSCGTYVFDLDKNDCGFCGQPQNKTEIVELESYTAAERVPTVPKNSERPVCLVGVNI